MAKYDAIIIGSGFGGAVAACRLAEKGMNVLVLERGRRWEPKDYPRQPDDPWLFDPQQPHQKNGWLDLRIYDEMTIAMGAGVGGGSLIYANVSVEAKQELFQHGWPPEITYAELKPYYDKVGKMLNVQTLPENQLTQRYRLMQEAAEKLGYGARFQKLPLAVTFNSNWHDGLVEAFDDKHSQKWINAQGVEQGTCVHCGNCDLGCQVRAKNTLDLNYIPWAEKHGAAVRPLHLAKFIRPQDGAYEVHFDRLEKGQRLAGVEAARRVILAAGSLGSTELLLRCRDEHKTLPRLSRSLGHHWSSNGDFLTPAFYENRKISPAQGPTITCAIDFLDGSVDQQKFWIEDGGFPDLLRNYLQIKSQRGTKNRKYQMLLDALPQHDSFKNCMPWFAQGLDAADGRLFLHRSWKKLGKRELKLEWDITRSAAVIEAIINMHKRLAAATGGKPWVPPTWTLSRNLTTPHPLGGCNMGTTPENGVVNHRGEVFGYRNLYVADGAIIPKALGLNPSRTIAALAERMAALMESKD